MKLHARIAGTLMFIVLIAASVGAYTTYIKAPAVLFDQNAGVLTSVSLNVTPGNGTVAVRGPQIVNASTLGSAQTAAQYASSYVGVNEKNYNFIYTIYNATNVSGPSGGLVMTLLAVAALDHEQLSANFTATGTINSDGSVGEIGGVYDKASAAAKNGMRYILVPSVPAGSFEQQLYYITQQQFNIPLIAVSNVSQALSDVYGRTSLVPVNYSFVTNYYPSSLTSANITCNGCNMSPYTELETFTLNTTNQSISALGPEYSNLKAQMMHQQSEYAQIANKGYLYSASDLSFLLYINSYTVLNAENVSALSANLLISNVSQYCASLTPPPMTNLNYEYIIGGELRQSWGGIYSGLAQQQLNAAQTSDDLIAAQNTAAKASGWCKAANEMYNIASSVGGQYVSLSPSVKANATKALNTIAAYGSQNLYYMSAYDSYKEGNYAASLYASSYATAFYGSSQSNSTEVADLLGNLSSYNYGVWPTQFALQSQFYSEEARLNGNQTYTSSAFYTAELAKLLSSDDQQLTGSFNYSVTAPTTVSSASLTQLSNEVSQLQQEINGLYVFLLAILVILFTVFVLLLFSLLARHPRHNGNRSRRSAR